MRGLALCSFLRCHSSFPPLKPSVLCSHVSKFYVCVCAFAGAVGSLFKSFLLTAILDLLSAQRPRETAELTQKQQHCWFFCFVLVFFQPSHLAQTHLSNYYFSRSDFQLSNVASWACFNFILYAETTSVVFTTPKIASGKKKGRHIKTAG